MAEIFLQHIEHKHIKHLLDTKNIIYYTRYVDDILIIYNTRHINDNTIQKYINQIHNNIQLTPTHDSNGQINYLDLTIIRNNTKLEISIYRKPTTTNTTISYESNHPTEHKTAAYRQYIKRMQSLPPTKNRMDDNKNHSKKQQFPRPRNNATKITNTTKNTQNKKQ